MINITVVTMLGQTELAKVTVPADGTKTVVVQVDPLVMSRVIANIVELEVQRLIIARMR